MDKTPQALTGENLPLGDRHNMLYFGTAVTYGWGVAVVVDTGMRTELGRIAEWIQGVPTELTPLQKRIKQSGHFRHGAAHPGRSGAVFGLEHDRLLGHRGREVVATTCHAMLG